MNNFPPLQRLNNRKTSTTGASMPRRTPKLLALTMLTTLSLLASLTFSARPLPASGTTPFIFEDNRVFAELTFLRPDGSPRKAYAFVDLGTPALILNESLTKDLQFDETHPLIFQIGELKISVNSRDVEKDTGTFFTGPEGKKTVPVEAVLPGSIMKNYQVTFDYAAHTLTFLPPNTVKPEGIAMPCRVNEKTGLISIDAQIAGHTYQVAIDSGSAYTWLRADVTDQWLTTHPEWKRGKGAVGESNMQSRPDGAEAAATILRLPEITLGSLHLEEIGALGIAPKAPPFPPAPGEPPVHGNFFDWYSRKTPEPVVGWLGGNALKGFRITIDFPNHITYWQRETNLDPHDLDQVGITLETHNNEKGYFIAAITEQNGKPTVEGLQVGDKLIQIDNLLVSDLTRGGIFSALHGKPGTTRPLLLERNGLRFTAQAKVTAF
jgi:hypothetical protein